MTWSINRSETAEKRGCLARRLRIAAGCLLLCIGGIGVFLPILPTTPFVLLAMACFAKEPKFQAWIRRSAFFCEYLDAYQQRRGISGRILVRSLFFLWGMLGLSAFLVGKLWLAILFVGIGTAVTTHLVQLWRRGREMQFTLVELLVVIAIIVILAGLIFPALADARDRASKITCTGNQRQLGQALEFYAADYAGMIPDTSGGYWGSSIPIVRMYGGVPFALGKVLGPYRLPPRIFGCPANVARSPAYVRENWEKPGAVVQTAYLYRETEAGFRPKKSSPHNRGRALLVDFACLYATGILMPHNFKSVNLLYNDGHVESRFNSPVPEEHYTLTGSSGITVPSCEFVWHNADR